MNAPSTSEKTGISHSSVVICERSVRSAIGGRNCRLWIYAIILPSSDLSVAHSDEEVAGSDLGCLDGLSVLLIVVQFLRQFKL